MCVMWLLFSVFLRLRLPLDRDGLNAREVRADRRGQHERDDKAIETKHFGKNEDKNHGREDARLLR